MNNIWQNGKWSMGLLRWDVSEMIYIEIVGGNIHCYQTDEFLCKQFVFTECGPKRPTNDGIKP